MAGGASPARRRDRRRSTSSRSLYSALVHPGNEQGLTPSALGADARRCLHRERHRHLHVDPVRRGADVPRARLLAARARSAAGRRSSRVGLIFGLAHGLIVSLPVIVVFGCVLAWIRSRHGQRLPRDAAARDVQPGRADRRRHGRQRLTRRLHSAGASPRVSRRARRARRSRRPHTRPAPCGVTATPVRGSAPLTVTFTATCSSTAYAWDVRRRRAGSRPVGAARLPRPERWYATLATRSRHRALRRR